MPFSALLMMAMSIGAPSAARDTAATMDSVALARYVQSALQDRLQIAGSTARVSVDAITALPSAEEGLRYEVGEVAGRWPRAQATVPVRVSREGRLLRTLTVGVTSQDLREVTVFARDYPARTRATRMRLEEEEVDMTCCASPALAALPAETMRLRRAVRAGEPLLAEDFERVPDVEGQQEVRVQVRRGAITLSAQARALQDGRIGDRVQVLPSYTTQAIAAIVTGSGEVEIRE